MYAKYGAALRSTAIGMCLGIGVCALSSCSPTGGSVLGPGPNDPPTDAEMTGVVQAYWPAYMGAYSVEPSRYVGLANLTSVTAADPGVTDNELGMMIHKGMAHFTFTVVSDIQYHCLPQSDSDEPPIYYEPLTANPGDQKVARAGETVVCDNGIGFLKAINGWEYMPMGSGKLWIIPRPPENK